MAISFLDLLRQASPDLGILRAPGQTLEGLEAADHVRLAGAQLAQAVNSSTVFWGVNIPDGTERRLDDISGVVVKRVHVFDLPGVDDKFSPGEEAVPVFV